MSAFPPRHHAQHDEAHVPLSKVAGLACNGTEQQGKLAKLFSFGGSEWESNPPRTTKSPYAGFEDRDDHRTACASM